LYVYFFLSFFFYVWTKNSYLGEKIENLESINEKLEELKNRVYEALMKQRKENKRLREVNNKFNQKLKNK
jgi:hypothetical protein